MRNEITFVAPSFNSVKGQDRQPGRADLVAPDVYFHQGAVSDTADAVCNNGWIIFEDSVLVIDANFPAGAKLIISKIPTRK